MQQSIYANATNMQYTAKSARKQLISRKKSVPVDHSTENCHKASMITPQDY